MILEVVEKTVNATKVMAQSTTYIWRLVALDLEAQLFSPLPHFASDTLHHPENCSNLNCPFEFAG